jgi:3-hydroxyanthranilate 3,4-dioxygenase
MPSLKPLNFSRWIDEHRHLLRPPVGNAQIWADRDFMVTVVGGPNSRTDFHINQGEEFFHQLEGDMILRVLIDGKKEDIPIRAGEIFLLPGNLPHSPQRPAGTVGLVLERKRRDDELDSFLWVCDRCGHQLYKESLHVSDLVTQLPPVFARYWGDPQHTTCTACGQTHEKVAATASAGRM